MAAAPDLLEACKLAYDWVVWLSGRSPITYRGEAEVAETLRTVVAKAEGRQE